MTLQTFLSPHKWRWGILSPFWQPHRPWLYSLVTRGLEPDLWANSPHVWNSHSYVGDRLVGVNLRHTLSCLKYIKSYLSDMNLRLTQSQTNFATQLGEP